MYSIKALQACRTINIARTYIIGSRAVIKPLALVTQNSDLWSTFYNIITFSVCCFDSPSVWYICKNTGTVIVDEKHCRVLSIRGQIHQTPAHKHLDSNWTRDSSAIHLIHPELGNMELPAFVSEVDTVYYESSAAPLSFSSKSCIESCECSLQIFLFSHFFFLPHMPDLWVVGWGTATSRIEGHPLPDSSWLGITFLTTAPSADLGSIATRVCGGGGNSGLFAPAPSPDLSSYMLPRLAVATAVLVFCFTFLFSFCCIHDSPLLRITGLSQ